MGSKKSTWINWTNHMRIYGMFSHMLVNFQVQHRVRYANRVTHQASTRTIRSWPPKDQTEPRDQRVQRPKMIDWNSNRKPITSVFRAPGFLWIFPSTAQSRSTSFFGWGSWPFFGGHLELLHAFALVFLCEPSRLCWKGHIIQHEYAWWLTIQVGIAIQNHYVITINDQSNYIHCYSFFKHQVWISRTIYHGH